MAGGQLVPWPADLSRAIAVLPDDAPAEESFRSWLLRHVGASAAEAILGLIFIATFDHDPGRLSAAFARERLRRALSGGVRYVVGGWSTLVGLLAERAAGLGVRIQTRTRVPALPAGQTILATSLATARQLTGDRSLAWPSARVATFDLGLRADAGPGWFRVMDLDDRIYAARYSVADPTLAPPGHELIQVAAACSPRERKTDAERRVQRLLDQSWPGWRAAMRWQRSCVRTHCTGAIDLPGTTWRDRPAIRRGSPLAVATDQSAAPGLLAEAAITAAQLAVQQLLVPSSDAVPAPIRLTNTRPTMYGLSCRQPVRSGLATVGSPRDYPFQLHREGAHCHDVLGYGAPPPWKGFPLARWRYCAVALGAGRRVLGTPDR